MYFPIEPRLKHHVWRPQPPAKSAEVTHGQVFVQDQKTLIFRLICVMKKLNTTIINVFLSSKILMIITF